MYFHWFHKMINQMASLMLFGEFISDYFHLCQEKVLMYIYTCIIIIIIYAYPVITEMVLPFLHFCWKCLFFLNFVLSGFSAIDHSTRPIAYRSASLESNTVLLKALLWCFLSTRVHSAFELRSTVHQLSIFMSDLA